MKKIIAIFAIAASLAACTSTEQGAGIGAVSGGILGAAVTGNVRGAAVGAGIGGLTGAAIGNSQEDRNDGSCVYRDRDGNRYVDRC